MAHGARGDVARQMQLRLAEQWRGLCAVPREVAISSGQALVPGVTFWLDAEQGQQSLHGGPARGGGVNIKTKVEAPGRWMGLHFQLGDHALADLAVLGVYSQQRAARAMTWRMCLRSGTADGFVDHFFDKHTVAYAASATHVGTLELAAQTGLPRGTTWRELILFFHPESFDLTVQDLRLFGA